MVVRINSIIVYQKIIVVLLYLLQRASPSSFYQALELQSEYSIEFEKNHSVSLLSVRCRYNGDGSDNNLIVTMMDNDFGDAAMVLMIMGNGDAAMVLMIMGNGDANVMITMLRRYQR